MRSLNYIRTYYKFIQKCAQMYVWLGKTKQTDSYLSAIPLQNRVRALISYMTTNYNLMQMTDVIKAKIRLTESRVWKWCRGCRFT